MNSKNIRQAYSEVDEFISLLSDEERNKIPEHLRDIFREKKDTNYRKGINPNIEIKEQNLLEETLAIIAMLNLNYICEDEREKERLKEVYKSNEKKYSAFFQLDFNDDVVFGKRQDYQIKKYEGEIIIPKKENLLQRIIHKIRTVFVK